MSAFDVDVTMEGSATTIGHRGRKEKCERRELSLMMMMHLHCDSEPSRLLLIVVVNVVVVYQ